MKALLSNVFMLDADVVTYVRDGKQALDQVRQNLERCSQIDYQPITLLMLDFNMPHLDGLQVIHLVKELCKSTDETECPKFLMHTSNQENAFRKRCQGHKVDFFAEKPIKEERLAKVLL